VNLYAGGELPPARDLAALLEAALIGQAGTERERDHLGHQLYTARATLHAVESVAEALAAAGWLAVGDPSPANLEHLRHALEQYRAHWIEREGYT
jgi:hypothetical protein